MSVTATASPRVQTTATRNGAAGVTGSEWVTRDAVDSRHARVEQLVAALDAEEADLKRRAQAGDEHAQSLRGIGAAPIRDRAERMLVYRAAMDVSWCGKCGTDLPATAPVWWARVSVRRRRLTAPVGECCKPHGYSFDPSYSQAQQCVTCGRTVYHRWPSDQPVCCERHRRQAQAARRREQRRHGRADRQCDICGDAFTPPRSDARYCSAACRQKAYRRRKAGAQ